jgi:clan AA aspartic protease
MLTFAVSKNLASPTVTVTSWIDTAFDGHLVFPRAMIDDLELEALAETEAILADGSTALLETFVCYLEWFGQRMALQVIANDGKSPLLGTGLLEGRVLHIDYAQRTLTLD